MAGLNMNKQQGSSNEHDFPIMEASTVAELDAKATLPTRYPSPASSASQGYAQAPALADVALSERTDFLGAYNSDTMRSQEDWNAPAPGTPASFEQDRCVNGNKPEAEGGEGAKKRQSRWGPQEAADSASDKLEEGTGKKKRKSRWGEEVRSSTEQDTALVLSKIKLPDFVKELTGSNMVDAETQALNIRLLEINRKIQLGIFIDERPAGARSPSPEPVYDSKGIRINTREFRVKERMTRERNEVIAELIRKNPSYKPPPDYRPPKLYKKLRIPVNEYPGYNFIGLIIGPRGNTQKRMERETGAKILIRGKGSVKDGCTHAKRDPKPDSTDDEDLHVFIEATTQKSLDEAVAMVQKLLVPVDEVINEHKRQQLKELAALNGTTLAEERCRLCGESGHRQYNCPSRQSTFKSNVLCKICGDGGHPTVDCPLKGTSENKMEDEYKSFLSELGGPLSERLPSSSDYMTGTALNDALELQNGNSAVAINRSAQGEGEGFGGDALAHDEGNLYVGFLPNNMDEDALSRLFQQFGSLRGIKIIKDRNTGQSKGYGFVKFLSPSSAKLAIEKMNGYRLEGKNLVVRFGSKSQGAKFNPPGAPTPAPSASAFAPPVYSPIMSAKPPSYDQSAGLQSLQGLDPHHHPLQASEMSSLGWNPPGHGADAARQFPHHQYPQIQPQQYQPTQHHPPHSVVHPSPQPPYYHPPQPYNSYAYPQSHARPYGYPPVEQSSPYGAPSPSPSPGGMFVASQRANSGMSNYPSHYPSQDQGSYMQNPPRPGGYPPSNEVRSEGTTPPWTSAPAPKPAPDAEPDAKTSVESEYERFMSEMNN